MPLAPPFTRDNAREMARRGNIARWSRYRARKAENASLPATLAGLALDDYAKLSLAQVRAHVARVDKLLETEKDPLSVERLARARLALCEQEFALAGRPKPGQRRPGPAPEPPPAPAPAFRPRPVRRPVTSPPAPASHPYIPPAASNPEDPSPIQQAPID